MKINVARYVTVAPRIVPCHSEEHIVISSKYDFVKFDGKYIVSIWPRYRFDYDSDRQGAFYNPFIICASENKLEFDYFFDGEQEYIIQIKPQNTNGRTVSVVETSVYALENDLFEKKVLKGDLHLHTTFSDGLESPEHRAMEARKHGFDFLAITDHNSYHGSSHLIEKMNKCPNNMVFLRGEEIHADSCPVHILSLGASKPVAPDVTNLDEAKITARAKLNEQYICDLNSDSDRTAFIAAMDVFDKIHAAGGISVLCHIYWDAIDDTNHRRMGAPEQIINALVEQCTFDVFEITSGAPESDLKANYLQEAYYREHLPKGFPIIGITDSHSTLDEISIFGKNYTIAFVNDFSESGVVSSIRNGQSIAVDGIGTNVICHGSLRLIKYATFLIEHYFPLHDLIVQTEGELMQRVLEGNHQLMPVLRDICNNSITLIQEEWRVFSKKSY